MLLLEAEETGMHMAAGGGERGVVGGHWRSWVVVRRIHPPSALTRRGGSRLKRHTWASCTQ
jgi:hypothetical protein